MTTFDAKMCRALAIGTPWVATKHDFQLVTDLTQRRIRLQPHPEWTIPETISWREDPFNERNWEFQFHTLRWLDPIRRQAAEGDLRGLSTWIEITRSWIAKNPPGKGKGHANFAWADMVDGQRAMTLAFGLPMVQEHSATDLDLILESLETHGIWLANPANMRPGNHGLQQHQGLLVVGAVLKKDAWIDLASDRMEAMLRTAYDDQGMNEEGAVQYHQMNYQWWMIAAERIRVVGRELPSISRIERAPYALAHATRPDGTYELIGDTDIFRHRGLKHPAMQWASTNGSTGEHPEELCAVYSAGYVFSRSGWGTRDSPFANQSFYSLRFGPQDRIHGHVDGGAVTLFAHGAPILIDGGKYAYDKESKYRRYLVSRDAHNSIALEDTDYDVSASVDLKHSSVRDCGEDFTLSDPGYAGALITRRLIAPRRAHGTFLIIDDVQAEAPVAAVQRWHLPPKASHRILGLGRILTTARNAAGQIVYTWILQLANPLPDLKVITGQEDPVLGWFSPSWRVLEPVRVVNWRQSGTKLRMITFIISTLSDNEPELSFDDREGTLSWRTAEGSRGKLRIHPVNGFTFEDGGKC